MPRGVATLAKIKDADEFFDKRDAKALAAEVGDWNTMIATWAGRLKGRLGD